MFVYGIIFAVAVVLIYLLIVRPILQKQPALSAAFAKEASLWDKLQAKVTGWRTYIAAWLTTIAGIVVGLYDQALPLITGQDWSPVTAKLPSWSLPVGMVFLGLVFAWLRRITERPPELVTQKIDGETKVVNLLRPDGSQAV